MYVSLVARLSFGKVFSPPVKNTLPSFAPQFPKLYIFPPGYKGPVFQFILAGFNGFMIPRKVRARALSLFLPPVNITRLSNTNDNPPPNDWMGRLFAGNQLFAFPLYRKTLFTGPALFFPPAT